jgi:hypothetical protein
MKVPPLSRAEFFATGIWLNTAAELIDFKDNTDAKPKASA